MRAVAGRSGRNRAAASTNQMGRFETRWLTSAANLTAVAILARRAPLALRMVGGILAGDSVDAGGVFHAHRHLCRRRGVTARSAERREAHGSSIVRQPAA